MDELVNALMKFKIKGKHLSHDDAESFIKNTASGPCLCCGSKKDVLVAIFVPKDKYKHLYGAKPNKGRMVLYPICSICQESRSIDDISDKLAEKWKQYGTYM